MSFAPQKMINKVKIINNNPAHQKMMAYLYNFYNIIEIIEYNDFNIII